MKERIKKIHSKAISCYRQNRYEEAIQLWRKALEFDPHEVEIMYSLGLVLFELKRYQESIDYLKEVAAYSPDHYKALMVIGTAYIKLRKFELAEEYLKKSLQINPNNTLAYLNLGAIYSIQRKFEQGIEFFEKALELNPQETRALLGLGKIYTLTGNPEKANEYFRRVIELEPDSPLGNYAKKAITTSTRDLADSQNIDQLFAEGFRYFLGSFYHEAIKNYQNYLTYKPRDDLAHYALAESQLRAGQLKKAFVSFRNAILNNPKNVLYYKELAILLDKIGEAQDVIEILNKALKIGNFENDAVVFTLLGKNYLKLGKYEEAIAHLKKAIRFDKNNLHARFELAKAYFKKQNENLAREQIDFIINFPLESPLKKAAQELVTQSAAASYSQA
ncbi:hypothetical protein DRQ00_02160 [candidate division KSB1 bacterium]|nr:MAG: hypothetical protein DRQ00_02160 [candidate division KSB1 bacterium]